MNKLSAPTPPPPPHEVVLRDLQTHERGSTTEDCCNGCLALFFGFLIVILCLLAIGVLLFAALGIASSFQNSSPDFRVESVSASVEEWKWVIGFSIKNPNSISTIHYDRQIDVSLEDATTNKSIGASIIPSFKQGPSNTTIFNSTMIATNALWPDHNATGFRPDLERIFVVTIKLRTSYSYTGLWLISMINPPSDQSFACENVKILFSPNATKGVLYGDPPRCS